MQGKIGNTLLSNIKAQATPFEVNDSLIKGFLLRVQPSGVISYYATYRNSNRKRQRVLLGRYPAISPVQARDYSSKPRPRRNTGYSSNQVEGLPTPEQFYGAAIEGLKPYAGGWAWGLCPIHSDRSPSLTVTQTLPHQRRDSRKTGRADEQQSRGHPGTA
jgi:hypothetical protein